MPQQKLQWHPAFQAALQIDLDEDKSYLKFFPEHSLTKKPMQIDILVRKEEGYVCKKKLARFFRGHNIIEYKNPGDYFSVNDFYKVMAYAGFYQAETEEILEILPEDITLTVICDRYPMALIKHLKQRFETGIKKKYPGIYYIEKGLMFPLQIVIGKGLDPEEYIWLSRLRSNLKIEQDIDFLSREYMGKEKNPLYEAVMDLIMKANEEQYKEAKRMCNALRELFADELEQANAQGIGYIRSMYRHQLTVENIAELIDRSWEYVAHIVSLITTHPTEDDIMIARRLLNETKE